MASRDMFSKILPNVKIATTFDADGKEVQVERREDAEQNTKQQEIFDILVAAGYFRARIKGLSAFDKIVGGMTWCIEACDFDVDVDLLFHENLTIGQKIGLTEKIVTVLPRMKCPYLIEPHQIQGLDFINIFPVIQWLVRRSVENRTEKSTKLKAFAVGSFHNHFTLATEQETKQKYVQAIDGIRKVQHLYGPRRQYKRKDAGPDDEKTRVRITLLEYGNKGLFVPNLATPTSVTGLQSKAVLSKRSSDTLLAVDGFNDDDDATANEIDVAQLLKNLYVANEDDCSSHLDLSEAERLVLAKNQAELKAELAIDTKQLSERSQVKALQSTKAALERKLQKVQDDNRTLEKRLSEERHAVDKMVAESKEIKSDIRNLDKIDVKGGDKKILENIQNLVIKNEELKLEEIKFKEKCRQELAQLQEDIRNAERTTPEEDIRESQQILDREKESLQVLRLQLAKKNRAIVSIQRQLDNIPDRTELAQYQRRFLELYNQVSAKHRETKQFYTLYNTLDDTKMYLTKELTLLNSIYDNYNDGMSNAQSKEQFIKQLLTIVDGVKQTKIKVRNKCDDEKAKRDGLNAQLMCLIEQQRRYATAVKQFTAECQRNEILIQRLRTMETERKTGVTALKQ